ncbi:MAG: WD40 repeat domain-containing protein [Methylococcales bacterium]|nr:WD40 repeat domain-containing protein [Methylococcales bacterium]
MNAQSVHLSPESEQAIVDDEHPWPGLASFREQDEHFFKGRGPDIEKLHSLVNRERLTILFGVSGLGKSSLLQAGLFPRLRLDNILPVYIRLDFTNASLSLSEQVFAAIARQVQEKAIEAPIHHENETLWEYFHRKDSEFWDARNRIMVPLLCFDQFEEVFTLGREDPRRSADLKQLINELADLVEGRCPESVKARLDANPDESKNFSFSRHPYKIIFSMREDYLADLEGLRGLMPSLIHNRLRLLQMNGEQALAVTDQTQGRLMERSVAETVVRLVGGEQGEKRRELSGLRIEPALLSLVCRELNEQRIKTQASRIDAESVASNREKILENFYERSLDAHSPELRRFIEDKLITVSGFRNSEAYDNALGIPGISAEALASLVQCRVLRLEERDGVKRIELIHDVLTGVVRKSRDQRLVLEKQRQAEQERREAEQREKAAREALRVSKRRALIFLILTGIALLSSAWGWWSWWDAKQARSKAQHLLAVSDFREAEQHYQNNNLPYALAYLAHAVRTDPEWVSSRTLLVNLLQQRSWPLPVAILNHKAAVSSASFSPDGTRVVTASRDKTARLWDAQTGKALGEPMTHQAEVKSAQFSPDGTRVVTLSSDNSARLWDAKTGKALGEAMTTHKDYVQSAQFSPNGMLVVTASNDGTARLWNAMTSKPLGDVIAHQGAIISAQFSPDNTRVVTASSNDNSARLWNAMTGKSLGEAMMHKDEVESPQFSPDGTKILTNSRDNSVRLWDAMTGKSLGIAMTHQSAVMSAEFSPDGTRLVTASWDKSARLWDANTGKPLCDAMMHQGHVMSAQFSPDGTRIVTSSLDKSALIWDANTGKPLGDAMMHQKGVFSAQFSPDGTRLVTVSDDFHPDGSRMLPDSDHNSAQMWDAKTGKSLGIAMTHQASVYSTQFSPDGTRVLTISSDNAARLWSAKNAKALQVELTLQDLVTSAQFSPDGTRVLTASDDKNARLWDAKTGKTLGMAMTHQAYFMSADIQFSPDGTRVVTTSNDKTARLWDAKSGNPLGDAMTHKGTIRSVQFNSDGTRLLTASDDHTARLWDANTGKALGEPMTHQNGVWSAQFSPDGTRVMTCSDYNGVRLWDAKTGQLLRISMTDQSRVSSAQFSPDGTKVVTASRDGSARLWDAKTGKPLGDVMKHHADVYDTSGWRILFLSAQFSPDGTRVLTTFYEKGVGLWDAKTGKPLGDAMMHLRNVFAQFSPDGSRVVTASDDKSARLWDANTGKSLGEAMMHEKAVRSAQFSPDGTRVVTVSEDNSARLWNAMSGKPLSDVLTHQDGVWSAHFSPDGTRVLTTSGDKSARLWDAFPVSSGNIELLAVLAESIAGNKLSELGAIENLEEQRELLNLRQQTTNAPLGDPTAESFIRWFLSDPWTRTVSPLSSLTVPDYIQQQIAAGRREQMEQEFPGHPLLRPAPASSNAK